jgi:dolichol-phosphate mannosyltransferase
MKMIYFLLPAYNEEENLPDLFDGINKAVPKFKNMRVKKFRIVLVNDGSTDRTGEIAKKYSKRMPMTILTHKKNQGLGAAIRTGVEYLVKNADGDSLVVTMDSDMTHDPLLVDAMLREINNGYDVVIASRYEPGGGQINLALKRRVLSRGINTILRFKGSRVKDNTSGFRCFRVSSLKRAHDVYGEDLIRTTGFTATVELLMKVQRTGAKTKEIPLFLDYGKKRGKSKLKVWKTIKAYVRMLTNF